ncbi:protein shoot gravitropism 6 [Quercus suber]|uniref:Protein shoot gravitropism 6 n=1 Tax=Quercus suber TaxID=58331 RepID=A0AAW0LJ52_QUESU
MVCISGYCALGCCGSCMHSKQVGHTVHGNFSNLPLAFVLPSCEALCLGDRLSCIFHDTNSEVRKVSAPILDQRFSISLSLPRPAASKFSVGIELSYGALSSLEDVIAILRSDASIDPSEYSTELFPVCILLTKDELLSDESLPNIYSSVVVRNHERQQKPRMTRSIVEENSDDGTRNSGNHSLSLFSTALYR